MMSRSAMLAGVLLVGIYYVLNKVETGISKKHDIYQGVLQSISQEQQAEYYALSSWLPLQSKHQKDWHKKAKMIKSEADLLLSLYDYPTFNNTSYVDSLQRKYNISAEGPVQIKDGSYLSKVLLYKSLINHLSAQIEYYRTFAKIAPPIHAKVWKPKASYKVYETHELIFQLYKHVDQELLSNSWYEIEGKKFPLQSIPLSLDFDDKEVKFYYEHTDQITGEKNKYTSTYRP